ncbi:MAG: zinc ribbon domain-containing protein [Nitrososphaerota archaeon]|nr:zinc ribbon domain-containing protein [Nitrososphaerota archaeon]MDG7015883.1 zinc ribbon domain-containing protein [Nitrososphaerota archaeon]
MRLLFWGLLFLLLLFGSAAGVASSFPDFALAAVFALLFLVSLVGLLVTGLVYLLRSVRFGARETYGQPALTLRGEVVRSNSERVIADYFSRRGIRYAYEHPAMSRWGYRRISRPDFYLPDYGVYVEFWGLVNVPDDSARSKYERSMKWKMAQYHRNGIRFVSLYPSDLNNLDAAFRAKLEKAAGRTLDLSASAYCANCGQPVYSGGAFCARCGAKL